MQTLYVVSHTHWDREWYEPFQVFRLRLVKCIDQLLDLFATDPDYRSFLLDGQTIVLEDYLEVRPDREQTLRDLVAGGKLQVGPWYILPDEFLVSGEALIRNLLRGVRTANAFGGAMRLGYIPDPFGHISQMPQILRGFGFSAAAFRRGLADEPTELWWEASDGTRVLACYLRDGYDNAAWLPHDPAGFVAGVKKLRDSLAPHAVTPHLLLLNGTDHMEPWRELPRLINAAREQLDDAQIVHASLPMYVERVQTDIAENKTTLQVARGELRNPKRHHLLPGVASTRMWIKQRNAHAQMLLEKWAEPFAAIAALEVGRWTLDVRNPGIQSPISNLQSLTSNFQLPTSNIQLLNLAWKYLLQNHPHDSICGCSVDPAHADMGPRFDWVEQIANAIIAESLTALAQRINPPAPANSVPLVVFNPVAGPRADLVAASVPVPGSLEDFVLLDDAGNTVPFQIVGRHVEQYYRAETEGALLSHLLDMGLKGRILGMAIQDAFMRADTQPVRLDVTLSAQGDPNFSLIKDVLPQVQEAIAQNPSALFDVYAHSPTKFEIEFVARAIPGFGYRTFYVSRPTPRAAHRPSRVAQPALSVSKGHPSLVIENEFFHIEPNHTDGTLTITDKTTGAIYRGANRLVDSGDRGDLYNHCPPEHDTVVASPDKPPQMSVEHGPARQSLRMELHYRLPAKLSADRTTRIGELVDENIGVTVSLYPGVRRIDFRVQVDNRVRDHRLRVEFPTPIVATGAQADQAFDVVTRALDLPRRDQDTATWIEQPRPEAPMQSFVSIDDGNIGLTLATRGLPEYEARPDADGETRGTTLALTLLRCVGWLSRSDLTTRSGDAGPEKETPGAQEIGAHVFEYALIPHAGNWRNAIDEAHAFAAPLRAVAVPPRLPGDGTGERLASFIETSPREFIISAIKLAEDGSGLVVRGYNIGDQPIDARIVLSGVEVLSEVEGWRRFARVARANLNEEEIAPIELQDGREVQVRVRAKEIVTVKFEE